MAGEGDETYMKLALLEAHKCDPVSTAFSVGCILVARIPDNQPVVLASGYSRELPGNTHAEANALSKAHELLPEQLQELFPFISSPVLSAVLTHTDVYTTLEPCSVRTSGLPPCADALITAQVKRCIIGVGEPDDFVKCEGARKLQDAGIQVIWLHGQEEECLKAARRGHSI